MRCRYDVDAAILFSDILVVPQAMGIEVTMPGGVGIQVPSPLTTTESVNSCIARTGDPKELVKKELEYVMEGVRMIKSSLEKEGKDVPLIGFSAAPWTLFYYMLGGSSKKNNEIGVEWLKNEPEASQALLDKLADVVVEYTDAQIRAGADCIQVRGGWSCGKNRNRNRNRNSIFGDNIEDKMESERAAVIIMAIMMMIVPHSSLTNSLLRIPHTLLWSAHNDSPTHPPATRTVKEIQRLMLRVKG